MTVKGSLFMDPPLYKRAHA